MNIPIKLYVITFQKAVTMNITIFRDATTGKVVDKYHSFYKPRVAITQKTKCYLVPSKSCSWMFLLL